jgi:hypothetical protein
MPKDGGAVSPETRGRRITLGIAIWLALPSALTLLLVPFTKARPTAGTWISLAINIAVSWMLYKGFRWVRGYAMAYFALAIFSTFANGASLLRVLGSYGLHAARGEWPLLLALVGGVAVKVGLFLVLWQSDSVAAYFDRENAVSTLSLTSPS